MGEGRNVRFQEDFWCGNSPLCEAFPTLYRIANSKGAMTTELWVRDEGVGAWNPNFIRPFNDGELETFQVFIRVLSGSSISPPAKR